MNTMAIVNCDTCDNPRIVVPYTKITLVCNETTQAWSYTYLCNGCGRRQVFPLDAELVMAMQSVGTKTLVTSNPDLSYRPYGPVIDQMDLSSFRASLNQHDHLAAYA